MTADRWRQVKADDGEWENRFMGNNVLTAVGVHAKRAELVTEAPLAVHTFRKSFSQNHADDGTPIHVLQRLMGHSDVSTTRHFYLQQTDANDSAAAERYQAMMDAAAKTDGLVTDLGSEGPSAAPREAGKTPKSAVR